MPNHSVSPRDIFKKYTSSCLAALALTVLSAQSALADLVKYSYTTKQATVVDATPTTNFISPVAGINFMLSGGIDRKLRISVTASGAQAPAFTQESARVLGATDVINYNGQNYYAEYFQSPKLADGSYTIKADLLSSTGVLVSTYSYPLTIDTQNPTAGTFTPTTYEWGSPVLSGPVWKLGVAAIDALTYSSFVLRNFSDGSGVSSIKANVYRESGDLHKSHSVLFSEANNTASIQYRTGFFPNSDLDEIFTVEFVVTDKAGNSTSTARQSVMFDNISNDPTEPFAVYDPDVTTSLAPGLQGFVPYVPGASVKTNPIRLAWRIPKSNWETYRLGGLRFSNSFGENTIASVDANYVYLIGSLPYRAENINYIKFSNFGAWSGTSLIAYDLILAPSAPQTPVIRNVEYYFSDIGWQTYTYRIVSTEQLPISVTRVRYTVEARPFSQVATHMGTCTIPAYQTTCEIAVSRVLSKGTSGYLHDEAVLKSADGQLSANGQWANVWWNDQYLPVISNTYNSNTMLLTVKVRQPMQGEFQDMLTHKEAWLESGGQRLSVTGQLTSSAGENFEYVFDLKKLPEGIYNLVAAASENLGAVTKQSLFVFNSDRTSPVVQVSKGASESINSMDKITFTMSDAKDPAAKVSSIILSGGPANVSISMSYRKTGSTSYALEYPILFPSLAAGEGYTLTVSAQDAQGNVGTGSTTFDYVPAMAGIIGHPDSIVTIPSASAEFRRNDGSRVIDSEPLLLSDGTPVAGLYDLLATLRADAATPLKIAGTNVSPGETVLLGQLNFTETQGRISLPVIPLNAGAVGSNGVIISTSAPNSPVVYAIVNTWMPKLDFEVNDTQPVQAMSEITATLQPLAGNQCQLTTSNQIARAADPLLSPVCLLEWTDIPDGIKEVDLPGSSVPMSSLAGKALETGEQKIGYSIFVYSNASTKVLLDKGEQIINVTSALGSSTFTHSLEGKEAVRTVETTRLSMTQTSGPSCSITADEELAQQAGIDGGESTCLIEFPTMPSDITLTSLDPIEMEGVFKAVGAHPLTWTASVFNEDGVKITLEEGSAMVDVVHPQTTTSLLIVVNESAQASATPVETVTDAWTEKTYTVLGDPQHGTALKTPNGFTYTPEQGYVGLDSFSYQVEDASGMTALGTAEVTVSKYNYPPSLASVSINALEGGPSEPVMPLVEDINLWDSHSFEITEPPAKGVITITAEGLIYTPNRGTFGADSFRFSAGDEAGMAIEGDGLVSVEPFNRAPTHISPNTIIMLQGKGGTVSLRVSDPNIRDTHVLQVIQQPAYGTASISGLRLNYVTDQDDNDAVIIRAIDQDGLYVDQRLEIELKDRMPSNNIIWTTAPISK